MIYLSDIRLQNFRSFRDAEIKFPSRHGFTLIKGRDTETGESSGTGKSAIFLGIAYLLDILPPENSVSTLQNWDTDNELQVVGTLLDGDERIVLARGKKTYVERNGKKKTGAKAYAEELQAIFGVSSDVLRALTYRAQDSKGFFLSMKPAEKTEFLTNILGLQSIEKAVDEAQERIKNGDYLTQGLQTSLDDKVAMLTAEKKVEVLAEQDPAPLREVLAQSTVEHAETLLRLKDAERQLGQLEAAERNSRHAGVDAKKSELEKARNYRASVEKELAVKLQVVRDEATDLRQKLRPLDLELGKAATQDRDLGKIRTEIQSHQDSKCPTCDQTWIQDRFRLERLQQQELTLQQEVDIRPQRQAQKKLLETRLRELDAVPTTDPRLERLAVVQQQLTQELALLAAIPDSPVLLDTRKRVVAAREAERAGDNAINAAESALKLATSRNSIRQQQLQARETKLATIREAVREAEVRLKTHVTSMNLEKDFVAAMGREGFLGIIFDDILQEIAADANQRFSRLANIRDVTLEFLTETEKGRRQIQTFVNVRKGRGTVRSICSGGMATSIEQVTDLAVISVIGRRTGGKLPGWLCLDEVTNGQGPVTKEAALEVLKEAAIDRLVLVIDHGTEFKEAFESTLDVEFTAGESKMKT